MKHRTNKLSLLISAIAICFALIFSGTPITMLASAQTPNRAVTVQSQASPKAASADRRAAALALQDIHAHLRDGRLSSTAYHSLIHTQFGNGKTIRANHFAAASSPGNTVTQVGDQPPGTGQTFFWDRKDDQALLVAFINAASPFGLTISGMHAGDSLEFSSGEGRASFSKDEGHPLVQSFIGLLATAGKGAAIVEDEEKLAPIIDELDKKAEALFQGTGAAEDFRDVFGFAGSPKPARAEGGIIFCLPQAQGPYYPGDSDHDNLWVKLDGTRDQAHMPPQIITNTAFFPQRGLPSQDQMTATTDGEAYVVPWDSAFGDNAGFYKVFIILHKGDGPPPPPPPRIKNSQGSGSGSRVSGGSHKVRQ